MTTCSPGDVCGEVSREAERRRSPAAAGGGGAKKTVDLAALCRPSKKPKKDAPDQSWMRSLNALGGSKASTSASSVVRPPREGGIGEGGRETVHLLEWPDSSGPAVRVSDQVPSRRRRGDGSFAVINVRQLSVRRGHGLCRT
jgi:hypothetical protein